MLSLSDPVLGEDEKAALAEVIDSGWLSAGERVRAFEEAFAARHGAEDAVAVSSGTAALHLCLLALGIGPGDEVLVPSLTFVATANAVLYCGARPVFVDIESPARPHVSSADAEARLSAHSRAVIVMHYGGYSVDTARWRAFADAHGLWLVEDAAHSAGLEKAGTAGDAAAFSFFPNKNMTTGEGGMVFARDPGVLARARSLRSHGMTTNTLDRARGHAYSYDVTMLGHNYRMDELRAALGTVQLGKLGQWIDTRRALTRTYRSTLAQCDPPIEVAFGEQHASAAHLLPARLPDDCERLAVMQSLRSRGIQTSIHYPPVHRFSWYRRSAPGTALPATETFCRRELTLPLHPGMTEADVERVAAALEQALGRP